MAYKVIESIIQYSSGTAAVWSASTEPIPDGALAVAIDTKVSKLGNGTDLWDDLDVFIDFNDPMISKTYLDRFETLVGDESLQLVNVTANGLGLEYVDMTLDEVALQDDMNAGLLTKAPSTHEHDYVTSAEAATIVDGYGMSETDKKAMSFLLMKAVDEENLGNVVTPDGIVDEFHTDDLVDLDASYATRQDGYLERTAPVITEKLLEPGPLHGSAMTTVGTDFYMYGGHDGTDYINSLFKYDTVLKKWSKESEGPLALYYNTLVSVGTKVYSLGGEADVLGDLNKLYEYDTVAKEWTELANIPYSARLMRAAAVDGKIYCFGGITGSTYNTIAVVYDPSTNEWDTIESLTTGKAGCGIVTDGTLIYLCGGWTASSTPTDEFHSYNPETNTYTALANCINGAYGCGMFISDGNIYSYGGYRSSSNTDAMYYFDGSDWNTTGDLSVSCHHMAYASLDGVGYYYGGREGSSSDEVNSFMMIDSEVPASATSTSVEALPSRRTLFTMVEYDGLWYLFGGRSADIEKLSDLWSFDPSTLVWTKLQSGPAALERHAATFVGSKMYVFGGDAPAGDYSNTMYVYDVDTNTWDTITTTQSGRSRHSMGAYDGKVYVLGGDVGGSPSSDVLEFDPSDESWTVKTNAPVAFDEASLATYNNVFYICGGQGTAVTYATIRTYNPATDTWDLKESFTRAVRGLQTAILGSKLYIFGGRDHASNDVVNSYVYDIVENEVTPYQLLPANVSYGACAAYDDTIYVLYGYDQANTQYSYTHAEVITPHALEVASKQLPNVSSNVNQVDFTFRGTDLGLPNGGCLFEASRDDGVTWAAGLFQKHELTIDDYEIFRGACDFTKSVIRSIVTGDNFTIEDLKGDITSIVVDSENQNGHFDAAAPFDLSRCTMTIGGSEIVITNMTGDGTTANSVEFEDILAGTQTIDSITGTVISSDSLNNSKWSEPINLWDSMNPFDEIGLVDFAFGKYNGKLYAYGGTTKDNEYPNTLQIYNIATKTWSEGTPNPNDPNGRRAGAGSISSDGKFCIYGGEGDGTGRLTSIHIYDIEEDTWSIGTANSNQAGTHTAAATIVDDKMYVYGGITTDEVNTLHIYDITNDSWTQGATNTAQASGCAHADLVAHNGKLYSHGGYGSTYYNSTYIYDIDTNTWSGGASDVETVNGRREHGMAVVGDYIYVYGGYNGGSDSLRDMRRYDIINDSWSAVSINYACSTYHYDLRMVEHEGLLYIYAGRMSIYKTSLLTTYDFENDKWDTPGNPYADGRYEHTCVTYNGKLYYYGGYDGSGTATNTVHIYDLATKTWSEGTPNPYQAGQRAHTACEYKGKMYVYAGKNVTNGNLNQLYVYDLINDTWGTLAANSTLMSAGHYGHTAVVHDGKMYAYGGYSTSYLNRVFVYDFVLNTWTEATANTTYMPNGIMSHSAVVYGGLMYTYGGYNSTNGTLNDLKIYDIAGDSWSSGTANPNDSTYGRREHACAIYDDKIYVYGGYSNSTSDHFYSLHAYDITNDTWGMLNENMGATGGHEGPAMCIVDKTLYLYGGRYTNNEACNALYAYAIANDLMPTVNTSAVLDITDKYLSKFIGTGYSNLHYALELSDGYYVYKNRTLTKIVQYDTEWQYYNGSAWVAATIDTELTALSEAAVIEANQMTYDELEDTSLHMFTATGLAVIVPAGEECAISDVSVVEFTEDTFDAGSDVKYRISTVTDNPTLDGVRVRYSYA